MRSDNEITTAFVLASGPFTAAALWQQTGELLRRAGAEVHAVTFTGLGAGSGPGRDTGWDTRWDTGRDIAPDTHIDLDTHIADVLRLIDAATAPRLVLVGHDYAIHPVLGAAQQRAHRISRIVHLDTAPPQDGGTPLALVPDQATHELLRSRPDAPVPAPTPDRWADWGDTTGLSAADLDRLSALAAPQPARTLTRRLRLTPALAGVPTSGILCTAGGTTIAGLQYLVSAGVPQLQALADPRVGFLELATGHWPMLSCPDELAAALLRAAAGEGHRLTRAAAAETPGGKPSSDLPSPSDLPSGDRPVRERPFHERPFVLDTVEAPRIRTGRVDLHLPDADEPRPAVLFVHGGPLPRGMRPGPRDWPLYTGYARLTASRGAVGAVVEHGLHGPADHPAAAAHVAEAIDLLRADPRVDADRVAVWFFSGSGPLLAELLGAPAPWLRCVAATYPVLVPPPPSSQSQSQSASSSPCAGAERRFRPAAALAGAGRLPVVLTRVGREAPDVAGAVNGFLAAARTHGTPVRLVDVPHGVHGFDCDEPTGESRAAVEEAVRAVLAHLRD
ncbi:alpha/beta fold hydrolase [Kitasatospora sp. NPDC048545]|uniref:alpha/beta fold hydrolase n=1 Tax=Kitasatospora sp. NPDC048545 TaxID=3157208 RepID=UPI0033FF92C8